MASNILIQEIEAVEENYHQTFRTILQSDSTKLEESCEKYAAILEKRIVHHDKEIERICRDYQGFLDSIRELLQVRAQTNNLNTEVNGLNKSLNEANQGLIKKGYELLEARKVEKNIASTIETLSVCMPVLDCYSKLLKQVSDKRYYPALKTLEILEREHLPKVSNFRFSTAISDNIPRLKKEIKSLDDFRDFLEKVRDYSPNIGERALRHTKEAQKRSLKSVIEEHSVKINEEYSIDDDDLCAQDMIDFSPIYRCLHIYTVLDDKEYFAKYYQKQRKDQAKLVLQAPQAMHDNLEAYKKYIYSMVGFFIVEDHVMNTTGGEIVTKTYLEDLWNISLAKAINVLSMSSSSCTDPNILLRIKNLIMLSITTLKYNGYAVTQLFDFLLELRDHYNEVLLQRWVIEFRDILSNCDFLPLEVNTNEEYESVLDRFPFHSDQLDQELFPKRFPFSKMVPEVYQQAMEFMYACMKFSEELTLSPNEVATMVRKAANLLLTRSFSGCLSLVFKSPGSSLALQQVVQIIVDTQYLEKAGPFLDEFVCKMTGTQNQTQAPPMAMFQVARAEAEDQVAVKLCSKLDEFFEELESYDWLLPEPIGHASQFIQDMISFLQSTFQSFSFILPNVAQLACRKACEHIANSIYKLLLSDDVKQITLGAIQQISLDLMQCELFAASDPVPGLKENELSKYFAEIRQLLDLLILEEWSVYLHDYGKTENRYSLVEPSTIIVMIEKIREAEKKALFTVLKKSERDKKKLLETVLKQLKQLSER